MTDAVWWYLAMTFVGWAVFPAVWRRLPALPSRGYPYARVLGWLVAGFAYWWLGTLGLARPGRAAAWAAGLFPLAWGLLAWRRPARRRIWAWVRTHRGLILITEMVFLLAFAAWVGVRAAAPEIVGTEKPMELAFIQAILRAEAFPPHDPWLSGYAISYYYFGYLLTGWLAAALGTPGPVAFNLGVALVFGLAASTAYGLGYDLLAPSLGRRVARGYGLLTPGLVLLVSNWEGLLEVVHRLGWLGRGRLAAFWTWLDILDLNTPPTANTWPPRFWWWWRASRVVHDTTLAGGHQEVIDEFPFFSFLLGDLHPHVLAIPFGLVAIALAFHLYRRGMPLGKGRAYVPRGAWGLWVLVLGGLSFLNTWDFPLYVGLNAAALLLRARQRGRPWRGALAYGARWALWIGVVGGLAYLPFYLGFGSQARGLLPNLLNPTRGAHAWVMFGPLWVPLLTALLLWTRRAHRAVWLRGLGVALVTSAGLWVLAWLMVGVMALLPAGGLYLGLYAAPDFATLARAALQRQAMAVAGPLTVVLLGGLAAGLLPWWGSPAASDRSRPAGAEPFPLLLAAWGALLVQVPNFVYLWDNFGTRMNTVFKFYYQAWQLWAVAAAYALAWLWVRRRAWAWLGVLAVVAGLVYPVLGLADRTAGLHPAQGWTLDGSAWLRRTDPDAWAAAQALQRAPLGTLAEAVGGSYSEFARLSTYSGQPAVVGWLGHEGQWRGGYDEVGSRPDDMRVLYTTGSWPVAREILTRYDIRYVALGPLERRAYRAQATLWDAHLRLWWQQGDLRIYLWEPADEP